MLRSSIASIALAAALMLPAQGAWAADESKYPDWSGQWTRVPDGGPPRYDPTKPLRAQQAPMKPEYRKLHEASMADLDAGGLGLDLAYHCIPQGVPRQMSAQCLRERSDSRWRAAVFDSPRNSSCQRGSRSPSDRPLTPRLSSPAARGRPCRRDGPSRYRREVAVSEAPAVDTSTSAATTKC